MADTNGLAKIETMDMAKAMIQKYMTQMADSKSAQQFMAQVNLMMRNNVKIASCTPQSVFVAAMACAHLDLPPNTPEGYAYIIPYGTDAQFQLGYRGLVELAYRSGVVLSVNAELVMPGDDFGVELGTERKLRHNPPATYRADWSKCTHVYATAKLNNGETVFEVLTKADVEKVKATSKAGNNGPWKDWPEAMAKKTALKRLLKLLPSSNTDNRFRQAAAWDSKVEGGGRLWVDSQTGSVVEADEDALDQDIVDAINGAKTRDEMDTTFNALSVEERKKYAPLITDKMKAMA